MYKATLKVYPDRGDSNIVVSLSDGSIVRLFRMSDATARYLRLRLNGLAGSGIKVPAEIEVGSDDPFFTYDMWFPILECLNEWYEVNHASV